MNDCNNKRQNQIDLFACTLAQDLISPAYRQDVLQQDFLNNILRHHNLWFHTTIFQYCLVLKAYPFSAPLPWNNKTWRNPIFSFYEKQVQGYWLHRGFQDPHSILFENIRMLNPV